MKTKDKIAYWIDIADYDMKTAQLLHKSKRYRYAIFMCQQALEKIMKAFYIHQSSKEPPYTHNLIYLQSLVQINLTPKQLRILAEINTYYIEGRYPSYKQKLSAMITGRKSLSILKNAQKIF